ncbi:hypothetical protein [Parasitella parasitica]|uniref:Tc1-like transposase DDE domain-containing protein n=1 Tax=Parasitella parasitica TaxID=35722 RepID=A0A0B7NLB4_9FUNG|nr:hypothetical protein [Parasitella parasitica]
MKLLWEGKASETQEIKSSTLSALYKNFLNKAWVTLKKLEKITAPRESDERNCVFVDEAGFNLHLRRNFGRSLKGKPARVIVPANRCVSVTIVSAICEHGIIDLSPERPQAKTKRIAGSKKRKSGADNSQGEVKTVATRKEHFLFFLSGVFDQLDRNKMKGRYIVMDNAPIHKSLEIMKLRNLFRGYGIILLWGNTISANCKRAGQKMKMGLRVIANTLTKQDSQADTGSGEFSKKVEKSKILQGQIKRLGESPFPKIEAKTIFMPFVIIIGLEAVILHIENCFKRAASCERSYIFHHSFECVIVVEFTEWQIGYSQLSRAGVICKTMGLSPSTVHDVLLRAGKTGDGIPCKRSGGAKALKKRDERALVRQVCAEPLKPMKYHLGAWCEGHTKISIDTFRKYSKDNGFESYKAAHKPSLSIKHMENRLKWYSGKTGWGYDKWKYVVWSDESKFNIVGNDGGARVLQKEGARYDKMIEKKGTTFILQEDGAPGHAGKIARNWKKDQPEILGFVLWPAQSPDLNPIEHLWAILEKRIEGRRHAIESKDELEACLRDEWSKLDVLV